MEQPEQLAATCAVVGAAAKQTLARRDIVVGPSTAATRKKSGNCETNKQPKEQERGKAKGKETVKNGDDFTSSLFSDRPLQLSEMMSALGFAPPPPPPPPPPQTKKVRLFVLHCLFTPSPSFGCSVRLLILPVTA